jgi:hypothetical protein
LVFRVDYIAFCITVWGCPYNTKTGATPLSWPVGFVFISLLGAILSWYLTGWLRFATPSRLEVTYNTKTGATPLSWLIGFVFISLRQAGLPWFIKTKPTLLLQGRF